MRIINYKPRYGILFIFLLSLIVLSSCDFLKIGTISILGDIAEQLIDKAQEIGTGSASGGGISNNSGWSHDAKVKINGSGNPVVIWDQYAGEDTGTDSYIYLKQWNGSLWEELGGSASGMGISDSICGAYSSIAINNSGNPVVVWTDRVGVWDIYIKQWNGSSWEEIGTGSASGGGISNSYSNSPSVAINNLGNPVVAWAWDASANSMTEEIYVKQWNGTSWEELGGSASGGGISNNSGRSLCPSLAINGSGNPVVAWNDNTSGKYEIYIKQWNGTSWEEIGAGSASGVGISDTSFGLSLSINSLGNPVVAWNDATSGNYEIHVKQWNGTIWEELGGSVSGEGININCSLVPSLAINSLGNPVVAYDYVSAVNSYGAKYIKYWDGSNWKEIYNGSASGRGIIGFSGCNPSLVIDNSDNLIIAYEDYSSGNGEIYVRKIK